MNFPPFLRTKRLMLTLSPVVFPNTMCYFTAETVQGTDVLLSSSPKNLRTTRINLPKFTSIGALLVQVELHGNHKITHGVMYHTNSIGNCNLQTTDLDKIKSLLGNHPYIIGGDFNFRNTYWKSSHADSNGAAFLDWSIRISISISVTL